MDIRGACGGPWNSGLTHSFIMSNLTQGSVSRDANLLGLRPMDRMHGCCVGELRMSHHRILLARTSRDTWVILIPHYDIFGESILEYSSPMVTGAHGRVNHGIAAYEHIRFDGVELVAGLQGYWRCAY